jgi:hypothetical protein
MAGSKDVRPPVSIPPKNSGPFVTLLTDEGEPIEYSQCGLSQIRCPKAILDDGYPHCYRNAMQVR